MFSSQRRIFASKNKLHQDPFCPYFTNDSGQQSLQRNSISFDNQQDAASRSRHPSRDGKHRN